MPDHHVAVLCGLHFLLIEIYEFGIVFRGNRQPLSRQQEGEVVRFIGHVLFFFRQGAAKHRAQHDTDRNQQ